MRIATGGISHETSTFTTVSTTIESAKDRRGYLHRREILDRYCGANTPIGGFIQGAEAHGFELIPTVFWEAHPSAPLPRHDFDAIVDDLLRGIDEAGEIDGILLELHGAMVAESVPDGEGHILEAVQELVGNDIPIVVQLDIHSNVSFRMIEKADVLIGRETYPEVDMAERGRECADILVRIIQEELHPTMALNQIPLVWGMNQVTAHQPMRDAIEYLHEIEQRPGVICASIATCYPLADVPDMGASVYVVTNQDQDFAQTCADELATWILGRREAWQLHRPSTAEAIRIAESEGKFPVIFADRDDNTGGGSPGDSTGLLRAFIDAKLKDACVLYIVDPEAVDACHAGGIGATLELDVGARSTPLQGETVSLKAEVMALSDGRFNYDGPMYAGLEGTMGLSAHIRSGGIHILLVNGREQPFCTAFSRTLGLDPKEMRYIGVKSAAHFRAGFEAWAGAIHVVAEPSVHNPADGKLAFKNLGRKLYPYDQF
jgi:microcystin degradation protein MlrC